MRRRRLLVSCSLCLLVAACSGGGSSPVSPSSAPPPATTSPAPAPAPPPLPPPPPTVAQIAGVWAGTMRAFWPGEGRDNYRTNTIRVDLQQQDRTITGLWQTATGGIGGEIRGTLDGLDAETTFRGTMTWTSDSESGTGRCVAAATFAGATVPPTFEWQSPQGWDIGATCRNMPRDVTWRLVRAQ